MYNQMVKFVQEKSLWNSSDSLLIGVSGGVDSVVLADLVNRTGMKWAIAHCNFNFRGKESDDDEHFVEQLAENYGVPVYKIAFDTTEYAISNGISFEMAARELRYRWFDKLCIENNFDWICVAHHADDVVETFLLNLARGTGIRGLTGIKPKVGKIVRPLLFSDRKAIERYAAENQLSHRIDSSNNDVQFKRNKIRHEIVPLLETINPSFTNSVVKTIENLLATENLLTDYFSSIRKKIERTENNLVKISIEKLSKYSDIEIYLYELLRPYNFKSDVITDISNSLSEQPGKQFFSKTHRLVCDRNDLIITPIIETDERIFYIETRQKEVVDPLNINIEEIIWEQDSKIISTPSIALIDADKLSFPLAIRRWKQGEYFRPLGMKGLKKISDFFIDEKFSIVEKENTWILYSGNDVVWIIGYRIDDRYKITPTTKNALKLQLQLP